VRWSDGVPLTALHYLYRYLLPESNMRARIIIYNLTIYFSSIVKTIINSLLLCVGVRKKDIHPYYLTPILLCTTPLSYGWGLY